MISLRTEPHTKDENWIFHKDVRRVLLHSYQKIEMYSTVVLGHDMDAEKPMKSVNNFWVRMATLSKWRSTAIISNSVRIQRTDEDIYVPSWISSLEARSCVLVKALVLHKFRMNRKTYNEYYKYAYVRHSGTCEPNSHWCLPPCTKVNESFIIISFGSALKLFVTAV